MERNKCLNRDRKKIMLLIIKHEFGSHSKGVSAEETMCDHKAQIIMH